MNLIDITFHVSYYLFTKQKYALVIYCNQTDSVLYFCLLSKVGIVI